MISSHFKKTEAKVLLTSVFGPYGRDDAYGSRKINPMELYQNQVTRFQGPFSLRMFHRSFGLMLIKENIDAPCTLLDFPSLDRFVDEISGNAYDIVGIGSIVANAAKTAEMCRLIRRYLPAAEIVIGGHLAAKADVERIIDADHFVKGDGIEWFRKFLGQDTKLPIRHPAVYSGYGTRVMGVSLSDKPGDTAAILLPSVGCPMGCNFCSTSALFGGKGKCIDFYETGDALFEVMCRIESKLKVHSFFVLDENFLLHRRRSLRLLELMEMHQKSWELYVFSSARVLKSYRMDQLVGLGIAWVWMGLEGQNSRYAKLSDCDTFALVRSLQSNGIKVLGSSIIGMENHKPEDMEGIIDYAVAHATDFHQFMLYTANPGTPLYETHKRLGTLKKDDDFPPADAHGQFLFNYRHRHIPDGLEQVFLKNAFIRDFEVNGPSLARLIRTQLNGWKKHKNHLDPRIRKRYERDSKRLWRVYAGAVWAMKKWYGKGRQADVLSALLSDLYDALGVKARLAAPMVGRFLFASLEREERRLAAGWQYEPKTFYEKNAAARSAEKSMRAEQSGIAAVGCRASEIRQPL